MFLHFCYFYFLLIWFDLIDYLSIYPKFNLNGLPQIFSSKLMLNWKTISRAVEMIKCP